MDDIKLKNKLLNEYEEWIRDNILTENAKLSETMNHMEKFADYLLSIYKKGYTDAKKEILVKDNDNLN